MSAHDLRGFVDVAADAIAANRAQHRLLFNPTPEVDSLAERLIALRRHGVPSGLISELIQDVKQLITLNEHEHGDERALAGALDALARAEHAAEREGSRAHDAISVRALVRRLRDDLDTIRASGTGTEFALAAARVREICSQTPADKLTSNTLRHELGGRRHDLLVEMVRSVQR